MWNKTYVLNKFRHINGNVPSGVYFKMFLLFEYISGFFDILS